MRAYREAPATLSSSCSLALSPAHFLVAASAYTQRVVVAVVTVPVTVHDSDWRAKVRTRSILCFESLAASANPATC